MASQMLRRIRRPNSGRKKFTSQPYYSLSSQPSGSDTTFSIDAPILEANELLYLIFTAVSKGSRLEDSAVVPPERRDAEGEMDQGNGVFSQLSRAAADDGDDADLIPEERRQTLMVRLAECAERCNLPKELLPTVSAAIYILSMLGMFIYRGSTG